MNKRLLLPTIVLLVSVLAAGCGFQGVTGSGNVVTEPRDVTGFTSITLEGIGNVIVEQGNSESLTIEAEDNLIEYFEIKVENDTLVIGIKDEYKMVSLLPTKPINFRVNVRDLEAVTLAGSGNIETSDLETGDFSVSLLGSGNISTGDLAAGKVQLSLAGSGNISLGQVTADSLTSTTLGSGDLAIEKLTADSVKVSIPGSGDVTLSGVVTSQEIGILGSGTYEAASLESETAQVSISGSGSVFIAVSDSLDVNILGSGDVNYSGRPEINSSIAGSGDLNHVEP